MKTQTTKKIREALMTELNNLMTGTTDTDHAVAVSKVAAQAIYTTRLELENKRIEAELHMNTDENRLKFIDGNNVKIPTLEL